MKKVIIMFAVMAISLVGGLGQADTQTGTDATLKALTVVYLQVGFNLQCTSDRPNVGPSSYTTKQQIAEMVEASLEYLGIKIIRKRNTEALQRVPILKASAHFRPFLSSGGHDGMFGITLAIIEPMESLRTGETRWMTTWERHGASLLDVYSEGIPFSGPLRKFLAEEFERPWKAHNKPTIGS